MMLNLPTEVRQNILNRVPDRDIRKLARANLSLFRGFSTATYFMRNNQISQVVRHCSEDVAMVYVDRWCRTRAQTDSGRARVTPVHKFETVKIVQVAAYREFWQLLDWILDGNPTFRMAAQHIGWAMLDRVRRLNGCPIAADLLLRHFGQAKIWPTVAAEIDFKMHSLYGDLWSLPDYYRTRATKLHWDEALLCLAAERGFLDLAERVLEQRFPGGGMLTAAECEQTRFGRCVLKRMCEDARLVALLHRFGFQNYSRLWYQAFYTTAQLPCNCDVVDAFLRAGFCAADYKRVMHRPIQALPISIRDRDIQWSDELTRMFAEREIIFAGQHDDDEQDDETTSWSSSDNDDR